MAREGRSHVGGGGWRRGWQEEAGHGRRRAEAGRQCRRWQVEVRRQVEVWRHEEAGWQRRQEEARRGRQREEARHGRQRVEARRWQAAGSEPHAIR